MVGYKRGRSYSVLLIRRSFGVFPCESEPIRKYDPGTFFGELAQSCSPSRCLCHLSFEPHGLLTYSTSQTLSIATGTKKLPPYLPLRPSRTKHSTTSHSKHSTHQWYLITSLHRSDIYTKPRQTCRPRNSIPNRRSVDTVFSSLDTTIPATTNPGPFQTTPRAETQIVSRDPPSLKAMKRQSPLSPPRRAERGESKGEDANANHNTLNS
jgi:hypothetical protein